MYRGKRYRISLLVSFLGVLLCLAGFCAFSITPKRLLHCSGASNENIVKKHLNIALLNVF